MNARGCVTFSRVCSPLAGTFPSSSPPAPSAGVASSPSVASATTVEQPPPASSATGASTPGEASSVPSRPPTTILTLPAIAFQIDYEGSAPGKKAQTTCSTEAKGNDQALSTCLQKARDQFLPDVLRFKKAAQGRWSLIIYKRSGFDFRELYNGSVELAAA